MTVALGAPKATRRERWAWYMYDFGNSAYAAVVLLAVYSAYFKGSVVGGARGSALWGMAVGIAMLVVAVTAPILGAVADFSGSKKRFLLFYTAVSCLFTALLFFVQKGNIVMGMVLFILAEIGYRSAQVFYNSLLPEIADQDEIGRVSGNGWAVGSAGGIICLVLVLVLITIFEGALTVRLSLVFTAVYFAASSVPLFLWLRESGDAQRLPKGESYISIAFKRIGETFRAVRNFREFVKFSIAFLIYNDGILMTMNFASILGAVLYGMNQQELIVFMILVQATSVAGAYVFGQVTDRKGGRRALVISLLLMVAAIVWMYLNESLTVFYVIGALAGFALTGVQSVSRSMVGLLSPEGKSAEFYGFFAVTGRTSSFIGPTIYGWLAAAAAGWYEAAGHSIVIAEQLGLRLALLSIVVFLLAGLGMLLTVKETKAEAAAT